MDRPLPRKCIATLSARRRARWPRAAFVAASLMLSAFVHAGEPAAYDRGAMMRAVAENWRASQQPDGLLPYGFDFLDDRPDDDATSGAYIAREAGAFWVWARYARAVRDERDRDALRRGLEALAARSLPLGKPRGQRFLDGLHVYDAPIGRMTITRGLRRAGLLYVDQGTAKVVSASGRYDDAWTGATALALLTELAYAEATGEGGFASLRNAWRDALLALYVPGRGFRESPTSIDDDDFATAEAWLALAAYAASDPADVRVQHALADLDAALITRFTRHPNTPGFQWSSMAAAQRWATTHDPRFADFLREQSRVLRERFARRIEVDPFANRCASLEGFAAMRAVLAASSAHADDVAALDAILRRELARLPRLQIHAGQTRLLLGGDGYLVAPAMSRFAGAFFCNEYRPYMRIDAAAHCLSALLAIEEGAPSAEATTVKEIASPEVK